MSSPRYISATDFTRTTLVGTIVTAIACGAIAWQWNPPAARGILIGGTAGALGFWLTARSARALTSIPREEIPFRVYRWTFMRVILYALALYSAYLIDPVDPAGRHALIGAAGGLFIARVVVFAAGIASWRKGRVRAEKIGPR